MVRTTVSFFLSWWQDFPLLDLCPRDTTGSKEKSPPRQWSLKQVPLKDFHKPPVLVDSCKSFE